MPSMELQQISSLTLPSYSRSLPNLHHTLHDPSSSIQQQQQGIIDSFQILATDLFADLSSSAAAAAGDNLLSLHWIRNLLDAFLFCQEEFRLILLNNRRLLSRPPMDRLISDFFDRSIKALDLCNAIRDGIDQLKQCEKQMEIVLIALDPRRDLLTPARIRRAEKALIDLAALFAHDDKESASFSWSVSRSWSAAKQLQAIGSNICVPRGHEVVATGGLANSVFTMNALLHFVMWVLVAAIPCQDRGLQAHFSVLKGFGWGSSVVSMHERIMEEAKKRERKKSVGLLKEIHQLEKCTRRLLQLAESVDGVSEGKEVEIIRQAVLGLGDVYNSITEELELLERQVRDVFHEIVRCRIQGLDCLHKQE